MISSIINDARERGDITILQSQISKEDNEFKSCIIGAGQKTKIAVAIGLTQQRQREYTDEELMTIQKSNPDFIVDLSVGDNVFQHLSYLKKRVHIPIGASPAYTIFEPNRINERITGEIIVDEILQYCSTGVDFICLPLGITKKSISELYKASRVMEMASRCGGLLIRYMNIHNCNNPFLEVLDQIIEVCKKYHVAIDMGDVFRPGCLEDGKNLKLKYDELYLLRTIGDRIRSHGVDVIYEGGGHIPINLIEDHIKKTREIIGNAPLWYGSVLTTDRAVGFDAVANISGMMIAALQGVDAFLAMTNSEHYSYPTVEQTAEGVRICHVVLSTIRYALEDKQEVSLNTEMGRARASLDWSRQANCSLFPDISRNLYLQNHLMVDGQPCTMCGHYCPLLNMKEKA